MSRPRIIIAGGGLSGGLAALALKARRPDVDLLVIDEGSGFGGNHIWSFFDGDVAPADAPLLDGLVAGSWRDHEVRFPARRRTLGFGYNSIRSSDLDRMLRERLQPHEYCLGRRIAALGPEFVFLEGGERIDAAGVIDARGTRALPGLDLAWQKFVGRTYRFDAPHGCTRPVIMDAVVPQDEGYRFVYTLPFSPTELMVEDTYYSCSPVLDAGMLRSRLGHYVAAAGLPPGEVVAEEAGVLPVLLGGEVSALWRADEPQVAKLGLRGGFFHPTTGYSLPDAVRNAVLLAEQTDVSGRALHDLFRGRAAALWKERRFYQLLNRMLFRAAPPPRRYKVLEHFYRLPEPVIARFYAGQLTTFDKMRILSGRPPVPVAKAIAAMRGKAA
ncbi:MAG TPA: lycopene beta-cyclase CrtY [Allosphingosinicella sp.]|jgi:lycopene beta-cyclase